MKKMNGFKISMIGLSTISLCAPIFALTSCSKYVKTINYKYLDIRSGVLYGLKDEYLYKDVLKKATTLEIPKEVKTIAPYAFVFPIGTSHTSTLPSTLETIHFDDSSECEEILAYAFTNCSVKNVNLPKSLKTMDVGAFAYCKLLNKIDASALTYSEMEALCNDITENKEKAAESEIEPTDPFVGASSSGSIVYNKSLSNEEIKKADFKFYANTDIPYAWFGREIEVSKPLFDMDYDKVLNGFNSQLTKEEMKILIKDKDQNLQFTLNIPSTAVAVAPKAFITETSNETETTIPSYITGVDFSETTNCASIGENAFACAPFKTIVFPAGLQKVGKWSFYKNKKLKQIDLSTVTYKDDIFETLWLTGCSEKNGTIITKDIPKGEKHDDLQIEENARWWSMFSSTTDLIKSDECWKFKYTETYKRNIFTTDKSSALAGAATLNGIKSEYIDSKNKLNYKGSYILGSIFTLPAMDEYNNPYVFVDDYAFFNNGYVTSKIPSNMIDGNLKGALSIAQIGKYAFLDAPFESVELPANVVSIESNAFGATDNKVCPMTEVTIPASCVSLDEDAFTNCSQLSFIDMSEWKIIPSVPVPGSTAPYWYEKCFNGLPKEGVIQVSVALFTDKDQLQKFKTAMSHIMYDYEGNPINFVDDPSENGWVVI